MMDHNTHQLECDYLHALCDGDKIRLRCVLVDTANNRNWPELNDTGCNEAEFRMWTYILKLAYKSSTEVSKKVFELKNQISSQFCPQ